MKRLFTFVAIFAVAGAALYAGPEAFSGKEMKQVAPVPPTCPSWTGFYAGVFGGYKFSVVDTDLDLTGAWEGNSLVPAILDHNHNLNNSGAELGGLIGYNCQLKNWVFGGEVDGGYLWARDSESDT